MLADGVGQRPRRPEKHSRVPVVVAGGDELLGPVLIGLLDEAANVQRLVAGGKVAGLDVAVAGLGAGGLNTQHHNVVTGGGHGNALLQRLQKARLVGNDVVGGKDAQHRVGILALDQEGGQTACRRGVASHRLLHNLRLGHASQLVADLVGQIFIGDHPGLGRGGQRLEPLHGLLDHRALAIQRQNLLGVSAARTRPEAGTAASGKYHRTKIDWLRHRSHILSDAR